MLNEIKEYLDSGPDHYIRSYRVGGRGVTEFSVNGGKENYKMMHVGIKATIQRGPNLTRRDEEPKVNFEKNISLDQYNEILEMVKKYI